MGEGNRGKIGILGAKIDKGQEVKESRVYFGDCNQLTELHLRWGRTMKFLECHSKKLGF